MALARNKVGLAGFIIFAAIVLVALIGPFFVPQTQATNVRAIYLAPSLQHPLGTDSEGRDILIQMINGGQTIILVGAAAALLSTLISITFGALAAYVGGVVDSVIMLLADVVLTLPQIVLLVVLSTFIHLTSPWLLAGIIAALSWPTLLRAVRAQVLSLKEREYVEAARLLDLGTPHPVSGNPAQYGELHSHELHHRDDDGHLLAGVSVSVWRGAAGRQQLGNHAEPGMGAWRHLFQTESDVHSGAGARHQPAAVVDRDDDAVARGHLQPALARYLMRLVYYRALGTSFFGSRKAAAFLPRAPRPGPRSRTSFGFCALYPPGGGLWPRSCGMSVLSPELGRAAFRVAILIVLMALGLLVTLRPGSAEFAITLLTLCIGLAFIGVIALFVRVIGR